jgi:hypothetical protein
MPDLKPPSYTEHLTIFADLLGFEEAIGTADDSLRLSILKLLTDLAALRADFFISSTPIETGGIQHVIRPAISTFSDHIVISYDLERVYADIGENIAKFVLLNQAQSLLSAIAGQALRLGFLFRGGATIGRLRHELGVVFGDAMVEAFRGLR